MILSIIFLVLSIYLILIMYEMNKPAYKWVFKVARMFINKILKKIKNEK